MTDEVRANPTELGRAAQLCLTESIALFDALRFARDDWPLESSAIGQAPNAAPVAEAYTAAAEAAGTTVEHLIGVLEHDVEALYQTAFAYQEADRQAAEEYQRQWVPGMPI